MTLTIGELRNMISTMDDGCEVQITVENQHYTDGIIAMRTCDYPTAPKKRDVLLLAVD